MAGTDVVKLWDGRHVPGTQRGDLLVFGFRQAPAGLATPRQLRAMGKRPAGQPLRYTLEWRQGRRWAALYRVDLAQPVRPLTPARRAAIAAALAARRTCRTCGLDAGFCLPRSIRQCWPCYQASPATDDDQPGGPSAKNAHRAGPSNTHASTGDTHHVHP
jgi:hypothetical protein